MAFDNELTIVLRQGGATTVYIDDAAKARACIGTGQLRRETPVIVYRGGIAQEVSAGAVPELASLLDEVLGADGARSSGASAPPAVPAPAPPPAPPRQATIGVPPPPPSPPFAPIPLQIAPAPPPRRMPPPVPTARAAPPDPDPPTRMRRQTSAKGSGCTGVFAVAIVIVALIAGLRHDRSGRDATFETVWARNDVWVRARPTIGAAGARLGRIGRGEALHGRWETEPSGYRWLKIADGTWAGGYAWGGGLSGEPRPVLKYSGGPYVAETSAPVRDEARATSAPIETLAPGTRVSVRGVTDDRWAEVDRRGGGTGYIIYDQLAPG